MNGSRLHLLYAAVALCTTVAGRSAAQAPCDPSNLLPNGLTLRDLSRNVGGMAGVDPHTVVYFAICQDTGTITRNTLYQPFAMGLHRQGCDEVREFNATLKGLYYSVVRMNDPFPNADPAIPPNPRIGYEYAAGDVISANGAVIGTFVMNGNIATNTSRPPTPDGVGPCYDCSHHEGYVTMTFTVAPYKESAVFAEYHFHTGPNATVPCDATDPCDIAFQFYGVVDGTYLTRCGKLPGATG